MVGLKITHKTVECDCNLKHALLKKREKTKSQILTVLFSKAKSCLTDPPMIDVPGRSDSASRSMAE